MLDMYHRDVIDLIEDILTALEYIQAPEKHHENARLITDAKLNLEPGSNKTRTVLQ